MGVPELSLLTISRSDTPTTRFKDLAYAIRAEAIWVPAPDAGYIERVLDQMIALTHGHYILRLDDDEWTSPELTEWLRAGVYRGTPGWKFPRLHRWGSGDQVILNAPLWPDWQTRCTTRALAGGRGVIHAGSPAPEVESCPFPIIHDKFLKPYAERRAIALTYDAAMPGAGTGSFLPFNLPEDVWDHDARQLAPLPWKDQA